MIETVILCILAAAVAEVCSRTARPKLYALINSTLGVGSMLLSQLLPVGTVTVNSFSAAFSAILGVPGTVLLFILNSGG